MIGLGRMGEGMSRRLIASSMKYMGIAITLKKAEEQYEAGYVESGYTTSLESLFK